MLIILLFRFGIKINGKKWKKPCWSENTCCVCDINVADHSVEVKKWMDLTVCTVCFLIYYKRTKNPKNYELPAILGKSLPENYAPILSLHFRILYTRVLFF